MNRSMHQHDWYSVPPPGSVLYNETVSRPGDNGETNAQNERKNNSWEESVQMFLKEKGGFDIGDLNEIGICKNDKRSKEFYKKSGVEKSCKRLRRISDGKVRNKGVEKERTKERIRKVGRDKRLDKKRKSPKQNREGSIDTETKALKTVPAKQFLKEFENLKDISDNEMECASNVEVENDALQVESAKYRRRVIEKSNKVISDELKELQESRTKLAEMVTTLEKDKEALEEKVLRQDKELKASKQESERLEKEKNKLFLASVADTKTMGNLSKSVIDQ